MTCLLFSLTLFLACEAGAMAPPEPESNVELSAVIEAATGDNRSLFVSYLNEEYKLETYLNPDAPDALELTIKQKVSVLTDEGKQKLHEQIDTYYVMEDIDRQRNAIKNMIFIGMILVPFGFLWYLSKRLT